MEDNFIECISVAINTSNWIRPKESRIYNKCSPSSSCYIYSGTGIYNRFTTTTTYADSTLTKKDNSPGGYSTTTLANGGGGSEIGSIIDSYSANLYQYGDWVRVHTNGATPNRTYAAMGDSRVSSSNKMLANVK